MQMLKLKFIISLILASICLKTPLFAMTKINTDYCNQFTQLSFLNINGSVKTVWVCSNEELNGKNIIFSKKINQSTIYRIKKFSSFIYFGVLFEMKNNNIYINGKSMRDDINAIVWQNKDILLGAFPSFEIPARDQGEIK